MTKRFYPAVLERGPKNTFGAWFPDFPDCVAAGPSQDDAIKRAESALAHTIDRLAERESPLPSATPIENIVIPKGCKFIAFFVVGVEPPDPSERVNIYLSKSLIARIDEHAADLGMSRSSYFGLAANMLLSQKGKHAIFFSAAMLGQLPEPHSRAAQIGAWRGEASAKPAVVKEGKKRKA